jgi:glycosyltransferase involved in cell wall biosynthesis
MLAQFYPPVVGGEEQMVSRLSHALASRGHSVAVATLRQPGSQEFEDEGGVRVYRVRSTSQRANWLYKDAERPHVPPVPDPETLLGLRRVLDQEKPELVNAHNWLLHSFLPLKRSNKAPLVVTLHDFSLACSNKRLMFRGTTPCTGPGFAKCLSCASSYFGVLKGVPTVLANFAMGGLERSVVDLFLPVSQATALGNGLVGSGLPYRVIPNFVPDDIATPHLEGDERLKMLPEGDYILFVGDLSPDKGIHVLLEAYAGLPEAPPLVLIGRRLPTTPVNLPVNVIEIGRWPQHLVMEAWRRSLFGVVPSVWSEPFGLVAIEAMASGVPLVASRIGGLVDIVEDGVSGLLVTPGDAGELREGIRRLLSDPDLRLALGREAGCQVRRFFASSVLPELEQVFREVITKKRPVLERVNP